MDLIADGPPHRPVPEQIRLLAKLDDGFDHADSVGQLEEDMTIGQFMWYGQLVRLGLAERVEGRDGQVWYRLTEKGWKVREEGLA